MSYIPLCPTHLPDRMPLYSAPKASKSTPCGVPNSYRRRYTVIRTPYADQMWDSLWGISHTITDEPKQRTVHEGLGASGECILMPRSTLLLEPKMLLGLHLSLLRTLPPGSQSMTPQRPPRKPINMRDSSARRTSPRIRPETRLLLRKQSFVSPHLRSRPALVYAAAQ